MEDNRRRLHVLVVDDDVVGLECYAEWLVAAGHRVTTRTAAVGTAADVVELRPDVALLDVLMPGLRGDDLARLLKRHPATRNLAVILHSCLPSETLRPLIMTSGALGAIEKTLTQSVFTFSFHALVMKLRPPTHGSESIVPSSPAPAASGTYRVAPVYGGAPKRKSG